MTDVRYDPLDTVRWMLAGASAEALCDTATGADGRTRRKSKARREADRLRYETLCEVVWNISGRPEPLETFTERLAAA